MRIRWMLAPLMLTLAAGPALASFTSSKPDPPSSPTGTTMQATESSNARQEAEKWYHDAYEDVTKAKEAQSDPSNAKKVKKLYERSIDRAGRAIEFDKKYHEAWNLQGFAWRQLGNFEKSVAAYEQCLNIAPDYAPAREYYGQTLLAKGDRAGAQVQLVWLQRLKADDLAKQLEAAIAAAPPSTDTKAVAKPAETAKADTSSAGGR